MVIIAGGVDVGSTQTKAILVDDRRQIVGRALINTGANVTRAADRAFQEALESSGLRREAVVYVVGTGYGRYKVTFGDAQITEISCHARGACFVFPNTRTVIDIGGQDAKGIQVGQGGEVVDFVMNDKCAAGTGRFLANAAEVMDLSLDEIGEISLKATNPVRVSTVCTVFVESDVMAYLAQGKKVEDILAGLHSAIASRTVALVRRIGIEEELTFTGGVSRNVGMVRALEEKLGFKINVNPESHYIGAIGAALHALDRAMARAA
ncbi:MAG: 2-hydroxyglutaryl-CoA dehydratase [Chloroflexi bacterium]|nr:2-hydroxyglutaryl-CoA dehydratase [Chloroflexota bacterium]